MQDWQRDTNSAMLLSTLEMKEVNMSSLQFKTVFGEAISGAIESICSTSVIKLLQRRRNAIMQRSRKQTRRSLQIESLEGRRLLAIMVTNTGDSGSGTLRAAIMEANMVAGPDVIEFNIGGGGLQTISPKTALPPIADPVTIDGHTQPGHVNVPFIEIEGSQASSSLVGLQIDAGGGGSVVRGLIFNRLGLGININNSGGNIVEGSYFGTNSAGNAASPNGTELVIGGTHGNNRISGNLISGNASVGLYILDPSGTTTEGNTIENNMVGTDLAGAYAIPNQVGIRVENWDNNRIGTNGDGVSDLSEKNVISGNSMYGIQLNGNTDGTIIAGNFVGVDASGLAPLGNLIGMSVSNNTRIGTIGDGIGDIEERNVISSNAVYGVEVGGSSNVIAGNFIGTNVNGTIPLGNTTGILVYYGSNNRIGTDSNGSGDASERNVVSGNQQTGVLIQGTGINNVLAGNYIGTDVNGTNILPNSQGVWLGYGASFNRIGSDGNGTRDDLEANVISGNTQFGIVMRQGNSHDNLVNGNYIGTNASATPGLGNDFGIAVFEGAQSNFIDSNVIAGNNSAVNLGLFSLTSNNNIVSNNQIKENNGNGIVSLGSQNQIKGNLISYNLQGVQLSGNQNNVSGNTIQNNVNYGISVQGARNQIGGTSAPAFNTIAFTTNGNGIEVVGGASVSNRIEGNSIHHSGGLGIDLGRNGVTLNDLGDGDTCENSFQNFPVLSSVTSGSSTGVVGTLNSTPSTLFTLQFYANANVRISGYSEGARYLGSGTATTDGSGNAHELGHKLGLAHSQEASDLMAPTLDVGVRKMVGSLSQLLAYSNTSLVFSGSIQFDGIRPRVLGTRRLPKEEFEEIQARDHLFAWFDGIQADSAEPETQSLYLARKIVSEAKQVANGGDQELHEVEFLEAIVVARVFSR